MYIFIAFVCYFRMIDWVSWPLGKNIDKWIIALLKGLAAVKKFSILIEVTLSKIEKVSMPFRHAHEPDILPLFPLQKESCLCSSLQLGYN